MTLQSGALTIDQPIFTWFVKGSKCWITRSHAFHNLIPCKIKYSLNHLKGRQEEKTAILVLNILYYFTRELENYEHQDAKKNISLTHTSSL